VCGGGGGGDGGAAEREKERQKRISAGTDAINRLFGNSAGPVMMKVTEQVQDGVDEGGNPVFRTVEREVVDEAATAKAVEETAAARAAREDIYGKVRDDTRAYFSKQLDEDKDQAGRQIKFAHARAGTGGSSQAIDSGREFQTRLDRGLLDVANRADTAQTNIRSADEQTRLGLIGRVVGGMDQGSAISSALSQMGVNAEQTANAANSGRMANAFSDMASVYGRSLARDGEIAARERFAQKFGNVIPNNSSYSGTVGK
jgi:hypothetical protein